LLLFICSVTLRDLHSFPTRRSSDLFRFLQKRVSEIDQKKAHITVSRESLTVSLYVNEDDPYSIGHIVGRIEEHPMFKKFGINSGDRKSTRLNSSHVKISYAVFCLKK